MEKKRAALPSRDGDGAVLEGRGVQAKAGVAEGIGSVFAGVGRRKRGGMSAAVRVLASKPFLLAVVLIFAKLFVDRSRPR